MKTNSVPSLALAAAAAILAAAAPAVRACADEPIPPISAVTGGSWPQWRGPTRDGQVSGPAWPESLAPEHLSRQWHVTGLGRSYSGPIVTPTRVYTVGTVDETYELVRAFDRTSGEQIWESKWEGSMSVPFFARKNGSWVRSTPTLNDGRLYVAGMRDLLVCLDAESGERVWSVDFQVRDGAPLPAFGFVCSPLVTDEHVYVQAGGALAKLDKRTGATVWRSLEDGGGMNSAFSSPVEAVIHDRPQLIVQTRAELCGVSPADGDVLWRRAIKSFRGMNILTPLVTGNAVFTAPYGGRAQLVTLASDGAGLSVDVSWDQNLQGYMTSPIIIDGHVYFFTRSNRFACVRLADGERKWVSGPTGDDYWSLVARNDRILALSNDGRLRLIRANPEAYEVVSETEVSEDLTWAHLAVAGEHIVIREQEGLALFTWK